MLPSGTPVKITSNPNPHNAIITGNKTSPAYGIIYRVKVQFLGPPKHTMTCWATKDQITIVGSEK